MQGVIHRLGVWFRAVVVIWLFVLTLVVVGYMLRVESNIQYQSQVNDLQQAINQATAEAFRGAAEKARESRRTR